MTEQSRQDARAANAEQILYWNAVGGPKWVHYQAMLDRQLDVLGEDTMRAAGVTAGESVLDVGCGCGSTTLELARHVGPTGRAVGVDISHPMLELARERAFAADLRHVFFEEGDAQTFHFRPGFDLVFSRFGVMFFDDPVRAFTNLRTALAENGRLAFVCWQGIQKNPWMGVPMMAALRHLTVELPSSPHAPGPFAFADIDRVKSILAASGYRDVTVEGRDVELSVGGGGTLDDTVRFVLEMGPVGRALAGASDEVREAVGRDVRESIAAYERPDGVIMKGAVWIVKAHA